MALEKVKFLNLGGCRSLQNTDFLSAFKNLEVLILGDCESLRRIDSSIGDMESLLRLELYRCRSLEEFPAEIGKLKALVQLRLYGTSALSTLPDSIGSLENLEILDISYSGIKELPDGIGRLMKLRQLNACNCQNLRGPREGGTSFKMALEKVKFLNLGGCRSLQNTDFLSAFKNLEVLILHDCESLRRIDSSIGDMEALLRLELCRCRSLEELPAEIGKLKALEQLRLNGTSALFALPDSIGSLENLEILDISYSGIKELPDGIGRLMKLRALNAYDCQNLRGPREGGTSFKDISRCAANLYDNLVERDDVRNWRKRRHQECRGSCIQVNVSSLCWGLDGKAIVFGLEEEWKTVKKLEVSCGSCGVSQLGGRCPSEQKKQYRESENYYSLEDLGTLSICKGHNVKKFQQMECGC